MLPSIDVHEDRWEAWSVTQGINGRPVPEFPIPEYVLIGRLVLSHAPFVSAFEEGDRAMVAIAGVNFQVIGYSAETDMFGIRHVV